MDSVLVNAIEDGQWAIFENANLCNPSILDRLNSLLEEGNHSLSINEQGLVQGDALREVKAHQDFRPIFLLSKQTLVDQGRDVSRALRNRCLLIEIDYQAAQTLKDAGQDAQAISEDVTALVDEQDGRVLDAYHEALKFDDPALGYARDLICRRRRAFADPQEPALDESVRVGETERVVRNAARVCDRAGEAGA